ncbi:MAG: glutathione S-transferase family protein [Rhodospirillaceae bacterium]
MRVTLFKFKPVMGLPDPSPFCFKLETYLRMAGIDYTVADDKRKKAPTGKRPFIIDEDGKVMADSGLIIDSLEAKNGYPIDGKLTLSERAENLAFQRLMDEHLYWTLVYGRWIDPAGVREWTPFMKDVLGVPGFVLKLLKPVAQRIVGNQLKGHGMGRHSPKVIFEMGISDIRALAHWLGQKEWGFGGQPTTFDASLSAYVGEIIAQPWNNPLTIETRKHRNLVAHFERMMTRYYPELTVSDTCVSGDQA